MKTTRKMSPFAKTNPRDPFWSRLKQNLRRWYYTAGVRHDKYSAYIPHIPEHVYQEWATAKDPQFPNRPTHDRAWFLSARALMQYFRVVKEAKNQTLLPSACADAVWHAWLNVDPDGLRAFQMRYFKRSFDHVEKQNMNLRDEDQVSVVNETWFQACKDEGLNPLYAALPIMFRADRDLNYKQGWIYEYDKTSRKISYSHGSSHLVPTAIGAAALFSMGYVSADEYAQYNDRLQQLDNERTNSGGGCGSSCGVGFGDNTGSDGGFSSDSSSSDSSGGSCGSSCGGGCGGD